MQEWDGTDSGLAFPDLRSFQPPSQSFDLLTNLILSSVFMLVVAAIAGLGVGVLWLARSASDWLCITIRENGSSVLDLFAWLAAVFSC